MKKVLERGKQAIRAAVSGGQAQGVEVGGGRAHSGLFSAELTGPRAGEGLQYCAETD